jgi:hypothetical protein
MSGDAELDAWRERWQARDTVPPELRRRVEREIRAERYALVPPVAVTVLMGGGTLAWALVSGRPDKVRLAAVTWAFIAITWLTAVLVVRGVGRPRVPAPTTTAFLEFTVQVCRGRRAAIAAAAVLYPTFLVFMLAWRYHSDRFASVRDYLLSGPVPIYAAITMALAVVGLRAYRRLGSELETLSAMRRRFEDGGDSAEG